MAPGIDWNAFREIYDSLTFSEIEKIYEDISLSYPNQNQNHAIYFSRMLETVPGDNVSIVELGCHQGHLANRMLKKFDKINVWVGYDFIEPLSRNVCHDKRYIPMPLYQWFHETTLHEYDVFLSSHTLEHLNEEQVNQTLNNINVRYVLLEVPILEHGQVWHGASAHVLKWGLKQLRECLSDNGFNIYYEMSTLGIIAAESNH